jgi:hypothetical protein
VSRFEEDDEGEDREVSAALTVGEGGDRSYALARIAAAGWREVAALE